MPPRARPLPNPANGSITQTPWCPGHPGSQCHVHGHRCGDAPRSPHAHRQPHFWQDATGAEPWGHCVTLPQLQRGQLWGAGPSGGWGVVAPCPPGPWVLLQLLAQPGRVARWAPGEPSAGAGGCGHSSVSLSPSWGAVAAALQRGWEPAPVLLTLPMPGGFLWHGPHQPAHPCHGCAGAGGVGLWPARPGLPWQMILE